MSLAGTLSVPRQNICIWCRGLEPPWDIAEGLFNIEHEWAWVLAFKSIFPGCLCFFETSVGWLVGVRSEQGIWLKVPEQNSIGFSNKRQLAGTRKSCKFGLLVWRIITKQKPCCIHFVGGIIGSLTALFMIGSFSFLCATNLKSSAKNGCGSSLLKP